MSRTISHYRIEEELGRGGMGVVYRAIDTRLGRAVAIKTLSTGNTFDADRVRRFIQEARSASALNHPHIVTIYEVDQVDEGTFIAMELVEGTPLDRVLSNGPLPVTMALEYAMQIASALEAAHTSGIVHRDIKPANIMITRDGRAKVLDFGLAKLFERPSTVATMTALATRAGVIMGTPAYMSPEQAEGRRVDARSDIFSFGAVLYEMLSGRRPFAGDSDVGIITSILRDQPARLKSLRADVPAAIETIIDRALAKDLAARYLDAGTLRADLARAHADLTRPADAFWRRPAILVPVALILVVAAAFGVWQTLQARRASWVRKEAIPEIERLQNSEQFVEAVRLARDAERYAPDEIARLKAGWYRINFNTEPPGVDVAIRNYLDLNGSWEPLGQTPLDEPALPFGFYRVRMSKAGYVPVEISSPALGRRAMTIKLAAEGSAPANMVMVSGGGFSVGVAKPVILPDFWLDKYEVSNREFKRFVDAGGYRDRKYWKEPFREDDRVLPFEEGVARFRDATGRTGPASWELGTYPEGQADLPVGGISWFEAAAFAEFSGKSLPTLYEWYRAANLDELSADILRLSNFDGKGPRKIGESGGVGPWGTLDMAGNVKEWCANVIEGATMRFILGGAWDEPSYRYTETDAQDPWERSARYGVRLARRLGPIGAAAEPVARVYGDPKSVVPASDELVDVYRRFYDYDRTPLNDRVDSVDDSAPHWRKERVSFDAAYSGERVPANLFLPKNAAGPFQIVIVFPSAYALNARSSELLDYARFDFIMRSGRAALYPVYQGTYERRKGPAGGPSERRDWYVQMAKDLFRSVDYLATRQDIDLQRLGYYSLSMGAYFAPIPLALEPRIKAAVIASGGLRFNYPPEIQPANFAPRVTVPVILINGKNDFGAPLESQRRLMELLGTPAEHKKHVVLEGGHVPNDFRGLVREALDWYDKYLGPVQ
jgi:eukaryotic-like serine/threonine-protein kinase